MPSPLPFVALAVGSWLLPAAADSPARIGGALRVRAPVPAVSDTVKRADTVAVIASDSAEDPVSANLRAFHARQRAGGMGYFVDEARITALRPTLASEALRTIPGVVLRPTVRLVNEVRMHGCAPVVWVDGQRATGAELDDVVRGGDVAAMEVYVTMVGVPSEFTDRSAACGTVLVWTRPA